jgi:hypothetical protein
MAAACAAQNFLLTNGYLNVRAPAGAQLELMDGISYGREDGGIDWERLATDRYRSFVGRLMGVTDDGADGYTAFYRSGNELRRCMVLSRDLRDINLIEAPCIHEPMVRISEHSLNCHRPP